MKKLSIRETLAVSAILIVLAAVIAPAFTDSLEQLQQKTCFGNLGVLARAMLLYVSDNNSRFPNLADLNTNRDLQGRVIVGWVGYNGGCVGGGTFYYNNPSHPWPWRANPSLGSLWPYTDRNEKTYMCPADRYAVDPTATTYRRGFGLSYQVNFNVFYSSYGDTSPAHYMGSPQQGRQISALTSDIVSPGNTVLLGENYMNRYIREFAASTVVCPPFDGTLRWWESAATLRHQGGGNYAMCDGSVRWVPAADHRELVWYRDGRQAPSEIWLGPDIPTNP